MDKKLTFLTYLTSLLFAIALITIAVKFTINFKPLYYFDIEYLNIAEESNIPKKEIIENYDHLIKYFKTTYKKDLEFPTFAMSEQGRIHFEDVKNIFVKIDYLMYITVFLTILGSVYLLKNKQYIYLRYTSIFLFFLPILLVLPLALNFDAAFVMFHKIFFRNDYWIFDPLYDPIIKVLPPEFFMHSAILILFIIILESIILNLLYKYLLTKYVKKIG